MIQAASHVQEVDAPFNPINNLETFVASAREQQPYDVNWDDAVWNIEASDTKKRAHLTNNLRLYFTEHAGARVPLAERIVFASPYADLIKACIVRRRVQRGMSRGPQNVFLRAARHLYAALPTPARVEPTLINRGHFATAEAAIRKREKKPSSAYRAAVMLDELASIIDRHALSRAPIDYRSAIKRPTEHADRTSATFEQRVHRLPTAELLQALATIANDDRLIERPFDLLRLRIGELLLVGGFRIGEALTIPDDPLVRETALDEAGEIRLDAVTGQPIETIGIRYWPEKGGEPIVKLVPTIANPLVLRAVADIQRLCKPARDNAAWLEAHPGDVNTPVTDDERLSFQRIQEMLSLKGKPKASVLHWFRQKKRQKAAGLQLTSRDRFVPGIVLRRAMASDRFDRPVLTRRDGKKQFLSESLFVMFLYDWTESRPVNRYISMPITLQHLSDFFCGRDGIQSVFERFDYHDDEGKPFRIRTHDFRRLLNVIAQRGGLSQIEIAQWMGRRSIGDNAAYDLRSASEMALEMRELISKNEVYGTIADQVKNLPETERTVFLQTRLAMVHTTPLGECGSNIAEAPCATAVSCLGGCRQYLRRKGDEASRKSLERIKQESLVNLARSREAMAAGKYNAENWVRTHQTVLENVQRALAIDDDVTVPVGEVRRVTPDGPMLGQRM